MHKWNKDVKKTVKEYCEAKKFFKEATKINPRLILEKVNVKNITRFREAAEAKIKDYTIGETTLILDEPTCNIKNDSTVVFSGRLFGHMLLGMA